MVPKASLNRFLKVRLRIIKEIRLKANSRIGVTGYILLFLFIPISLCGILLTPNKYEAWGSNGLDCNGPFLLIFAIPSFCIYLTGFFIFAQKAFRDFSIRKGIIAMACLAIAIMLIPNILGAYREKNDPDYQSVCGSGV